MEGKKYRVVQANLRWLPSDIYATVFANNNCKHAIHSSALRKKEKKKGEKIPLKFTRIFISNRTAEVSLQNTHILAWSLAAGIGHAAHRESNYIVKVFPKNKIKNKNGFIFLGGRKRHIFSSTF